MAENKDDFIDRKINGLGKFTKWIKDNPLAFLCAVLAALLFVFVWLYVSAKNENIDLLKDTSKQVQDEIRKQLPAELRPAVEQEVSKQTAPMREQVDTTTSQIKQIIREVIR
ncbi:hypothetical protein D3C87_447790 [compost metagenome]